MPIAFKVIKSLFFAVFASLIFMAIFGGVLYTFPYGQFFPCTDGWVQNLILALIFAFALQTILSPKILPRHYKIFLAAHVALILLAIWFGVYTISPLGYASGRTPVLRGFMVMTARKGVTSVPLGGVITLGNGAAAIYPITFPTDVRCTWMSSNNGALDDLHSCDTAYIPPQADYDILKISIQPGCGLPNSTGQFKVSILP